MNPVTLIGKLIGLGSKVIELIQVKKKPPTLDPALGQLESEKVAQAAEAARRARKSDGR